MKKFLIFALILSAFFAYSVQAQSSSEPILYLELEQNNLPEGSTVGVSLRVRVADATEAAALRDELAMRFFSGLTFTARLHVHRTDGPCEVQDL